MKIFLTICICAMVSAGIYGFVDMAGDVRHGTMIQYDRGESPSAKSITKSKLMQQSLNSKSEKLGQAAHVDLKGKISVSKEVKTPPTSGISILDFASESYSRGDPGRYMEVVELEEVPATKIDSVSTMGVVTPNPEIVQVALTPAAETKTDSTEKLSQLEEKIDYSSFSRGNPGKKHKRKNKE